MSSWQDACQSDGDQGGASSLVGAFHSTAGGLPSDFGLRLAPEAPNDEVVVASIPTWPALELTQAGAWAVRHRSITINSCLQCNSPRASFNQLTGSLAEKL